MRIDVVTVFPEMFGPVLSAGVVGKAIQAGLATVAAHDLRAYTHDRHRSTDDSPFGGGPGMVMRPGPLFEAIRALEPAPDTPIIVMSPQGRVFDQRAAERLASLDRFVLICGRYEGIDERVLQHLATEELSTGDYVLSGGEVPAMVVIDAIVRLLPGALGHGGEALADDSHTSGLLQHPQYTRPAEFADAPVPDVLLSGDHAAIAKWRRREALRRTLERRPDMLERAALSSDDLRVLAELGWKPA